MGLAGILLLTIGFVANAALACATIEESAHACCRTPQPTGGCHGGRCMTAGASVAIPASSSNDARPAIVAAATERAAVAPRDTRQAAVPPIERRADSLYLSLHQLRI